MESLHNRCHFKPLRPFKFHHFSKQVQAVDQDVGDNAEIHYSLEGADIMSMINIDESTGL